MMDEFMKLLGKKLHEQKGPIHGEKMKAKADMAKSLSDMLGEDLSEGMKKVTVASDSSEGLKKVLKKAEDILGESSDQIEDESEESEESEKEEGEGRMSEKALAEHEASEPESADELEKEIAKLEQELEEKKSALKHKR